MSLQFEASTVPLSGKSIQYFFNHPTTDGNAPWAESPMENTNLLHHRYHFLSILKEGCENYLFKDFHLKSGITIRILTLKSKRKESSETRKARPFPALLFVVQYSQDDNYVDIFTASLSSY